MAYWVDRERYPIPLPGSCGEHDQTATREVPGDARYLHSAAVDQHFDFDAVPAAEREVLLAIRDRMQQASASEPRIQARTVRGTVLPIPAPLRDWITRRVTNAFLEDVYDFLFVEKKRNLMRRRVLERMETGGGPFVVIGHSLGSVICYDVLANWTRTDVEIPLFITIGSPLGIEEVQDQLKQLTAQRTLTIPRVVQRWINVCDPLDIVAADKDISNDFPPAHGVVIENHIDWNKDSPEDPHSGTGYLKLDAVRVGVRSVIEPGAFQPVAPFVVARDLVRGIELSPPEARHSVLIELANRPLNSNQAAESPTLLDDARRSVAGWIRNQAKAARSDDELGLEVMERYVSAHLTRSEIETLSTQMRSVSVYRVYRNSQKRALLDASIHTVQAKTAHLGYDATGEGVGWAVLDSGINDKHPHFQLFSNLKAQFDCTIRGAVVPSIAKDLNGHGTHVAGIIAGALESVGISGIAPKAGLHIYKVLDDGGAGQDAWIIKSLDHIAVTNEKSGKLVIHGVNLSLGGSFDPEVFGCGDTPLCSELRRLWRQGVVVVIAAGNEGAVDLLTATGTISANMDLSIGDPANLEEAISVGSIHKNKPHTYGVSYFSSRGPTADGRPKPDLVAPGERICSCRHLFRQGATSKDDLYVEMSGTSMAAPHVSGILAAFLSRRRELIGYPDHIKDVLLRSCTDLKRDKMHQGHGMPNLVAMLLKS